MPKPNRRTRSSTKPKKPRARKAPKQAAAPLPAAPTAPTAPTAPPWADPRLAEVLAAARAQRKAEALERATALCAPPDCAARVLCGAAHIAARLGEHGPALAWLERAYAQAPTRDMRFALLAAMFNAGELERAEQATHAARAESPDAFELNNLLGVILRRRGRHEEALTHFQRAAEIDPASAAPWLNQGNAYTSLRRAQDAARCYEGAHRRAPDDSEMLRLLGMARLDLRQFDGAIAALQAAFARQPQDPRIVIDLSHVHHMRPDPETALRVIDAGLARFPNQLGLLRQRGSILRSLGRHDEAKAQFDAILAQHPHDIDTLVRLGNLYLWGMNRRDLANPTYEQVLRLAPQHTEAARNYCESLTNSRYGDETTHFERAYELACALVDRASQPIELASSVQSVLLRACDYERIERFGSSQAVIAHFSKDNKVHHLHNQLGRVTSLEDRVALLHAHRAWGEQIQQSALRRPLPAIITKRSARTGRIRVGLMSSDLCDHPVGYFAQPILEAYNRDRFEIYCYSFRTTPPDPVQQAFASRVDQFKVLRGLSDRDIAAHIAEDDLDILFELGGLTLLNKLNVCAWRPAPIQVSWLGYPHSSGLPTIDYLLVDPFNRPTRADLMLERPFLMPHTWVALGSMGFSDAVRIEPDLPERRTGHISFGTANNPYKYTRAAFAAWAAAMHAVPGSHFVFVRPEANARGFRAQVAQRFAEHGISADRIEFICVRGQHKPFYNRIDIALDPFPHVGGTTTCESLWMGVPTVTLAGPGFFERLSASNLHNAGLGDLCAQTPAEYVQIAATLAADRPRRRALRHGLRDQIRAHPLGQSERFVRDFEATIVQTLAHHTPRNTADQLEEALSRA